MDNGREEVPTCDDFFFRRERRGKKKTACSAVSYRDLIEPVTSTLVVLVHREAWPAGDVEVRLTLLS